MLRTRLAGSIFFSVAAFASLTYAVGACSSSSTAVPSDDAAPPIEDASIDAFEAALAEDAAPLPPPELYTDGPLKGCAKDPGPPSTPVVTIKDPTGIDDPAGDATKFTLDMALAGYPKNAV